MCDTDKIMSQGNNKIYGENTGFEKMSFHFLIWLLILIHIFSNLQSETNKWIYPYLYTII